VPRTYNPLRSIGITLAKCFRFARGFGEPSYDGAMRCSARDKARTRGATVELDVRGVFFDAQRCVLELLEPCNG